MHSDKASEKEKHRTDGQRIEVTDGMCIDLTKFIRDNVCVYLYP
jgi:hypothetical protein